MALMLIYRTFVMLVRWVVLKARSSHRRVRFIGEAARTVSGTRGWTIST
jgi:hypothetical protein